ncbi:MAG: dockerin type I repeat-containing protein [Planctomycetota bacterium]
MAQRKLQVLFDTADTFIRGDVDLNGVVDSADYTLLENIVKGNATASCPDAADVNDDGLVDGADASHLLAHLSNPTAALPDPFPACGRDPTMDVLPFCVGNGQVCP